MKAKILIGLISLLAAFPLFAANYAGVSAGRSTLDQLPGDPAATGYNVFLGSDLNDNLALEATGGHLGTMAGTSVNGVDLSLVPALRVTPKMKLYGKLGMAYTHASAMDGDTSNHVGMASGFGAQYDLTSKIAVKAEMMRYGGVGKGFTGDFPGMNLTNTSVGLKYKF